MNRRISGAALAGTLLVAACGGTNEGDSLRAEGGMCAIPADAPSVARVWIDEALDAIRLDFPAPTVHARNLFHLSAAMWDVWANYSDGSETTLFVDAPHSAHDVDAARTDAIAFAAHRLLAHRYNVSLGQTETMQALDAQLNELCGVDADFVPDPDSAASFGLSIADQIIADTFDDGSLERTQYQDVNYEPVNEPLAVAESGTTLADPDRWQPLILEEALSQNGLPIPAGEQTFIGSNWGDVTPFAITPAAEGPPIDPGPPPFFADPATADEYRASALAVVRASGELQTGLATADIGPAGHGNNSLGTDDGNGYDINPITGERYAPNLADVADWARVIAEYWADGPTSETPPGHWNTISNGVSDALFTDKDQVEFDGAAVGRLEWDVKLAVSVNGALHDAAIAAWGAKAYYDSVRPISMIRFLGENGELPLVPGLSEIITNESSAPGERHAALADHLGEIAINAWTGPPSIPEIYTSGVDWILAVDWVPYQRPTFVTPAFAAYVSGHSTFSRAAAEVLAAVTGSEYFPGGLATRTVFAGDLLHEKGPSADVELQWATYFDASDEAGRSRIYGGIHITADDYAGRIIGSEVGQAAVAKSRTLFVS
ncbi:vanadium-dependent haloperoxidase [Ilumatobacter sp.]|uniref:vanadium-dependent haloperoxidase n=1 Tax=Ilumatobacter sp. TaxID=1967498 RepID=UPI003752D703